MEAEIEEEIQVEAASTSVFPVFSKVTVSKKKTIEVSNVSPACTTSKRPMNRRSKVWTYFDDNKVCVIQGFSYRSADQTSSTKCMWDHLAKKHADVAQVKEGGRSDCPKESKYDRQKERDQYLVKLVLTLRSPLSSFNNAQLQSLADAKFMDTKAYGVKHFTYTVIPEMLVQYKDEVKKICKDGYVSITSDGWSLKEHSFQSYGISTERVVALFRDDAANMSKTGRLMQVSVLSFQCGAHLLNLCVQQALEDTDGIVNVILKKEREFAKNSKRSKENLKLFNEAHSRVNLAPTKIPKECVTRWNSTYLMLKHIYEKFDVITRIRYCPFNQSEHTALKIVVKILEKFYKVTLMFSGDDECCATLQPRLSSLLSFLKTSIEILSKNPAHVEIVEFVQTLHDNLEFRIEGLASKDMLAASQLVDPRYTHLSTEDDVVDGMRYLRRFIKETTANQHVASGGNEVEGELQTDAERNELEDDLSFLDEQLRIETPDMNLHMTQDNDLQIKLNSFRSKRIEDNADPYKFWKENQHRFPLLSSCARALMSVPPTSVASERFFSQTTLLFSDNLRVNLGNDRTEQILLLRCQKILDKEIQDEVAAEQEIEESLDECID
ncbi:unnamed protein product [Bursaphelenchus okinawaensis]|uniref:HAT C-terminal dimerisation domain-containing protein n=1 Tax=Bursaphelenchus okinawaensis TaxID=465554 RepID=A0A811KNQ4_9BILA|nr:unnamed protein product [Bursaphelenchus okinawaensis]CAG9106885.1 unnamed protein product [Bursaphelenchus okinawaensis]